MPTDFWFQLLHRSHVCTQAQLQRRTGMPSHRHMAHHLKDTMSMTTIMCVRAHTEELLLRTARARPSDDCASRHWLLQALPAQHFTMKRMRLKISLCTHTFVIQKKLHTT